MKNKVDPYQHSLLSYKYHVITSFGTDQIDWSRAQCIDIGLVNWQQLGTLLICYLYSVKYSARNGMKSHHFSKGSTRTFQVVHHKKRIRKAKANDNKVVENEPHKGVTVLAMRFNLSKE